MSALEQRLQDAIGDSYRIEKELGGGGMSRVFLAEETRLGRMVVIKVLPPEMGAGVNVERFEREIQLAAKLQHPHIVPLLTAGSHDDLLYYVMPYIEGESLRAKLAREGELPVGEVLRILRDVADALSYAHRHGVVHRDIKPDNVLLSDNHAVVTDFGVAKAVSASTGESALTSLGVALGTPAYMSPEQAAANPNVDHRADIYALGALAYETLCGRPPFAGPNPQAVLAAHVTEVPEPVTSRRTAVPPALESLVMRCLEKLPADRWQKADELRAQFEVMATPSGGVTPTGAQPVPMDAVAAAQRAHPLRVAGIFLLAGIGALAVVYFLVLQLGLPDWVVWGAMILLLIGLPIMVLTGHHERKRALARTQGIAVPAPAGGVRRLFTWRGALAGGGLAFAGLAVVAVVYSAMRVMGIGPVGTLVAAGVLDERGQVILADFDDRTPDATLGTSVTEAFRIDLAQSPVIRLVDASAIAEALRRMNRDPGTAVDNELAQEIAEREGIKAVVTGDIGMLGSGYVVSVQLVSSSDGTALVSLRESARDDSEIIAAVDRASAKLRERIGESLRSIRANEPLEHVTTGSLDALRKFSQALDAEDEGDIARAIGLMEEAIALDTTFAMAYRKLAVFLGNTFADYSRQLDAATKAYQYRDRLPELERYQAIAYYHWNVDYDRSKVIAAYRSVLELEPDDVRALNNLASELNSMRRYEEAEELARHAADVEPAGWTFTFNLAQAQVGQEKWVEAESSVARFSEVAAGTPHAARIRGTLAAAQGDYDTAAREFGWLYESQEGPAWRSLAAYSLSMIYQVRGRLEEGERWMERALEANEARGVEGNVIFNATRLGLIELRFRDDRGAAVRRLEDILQRVPLEGMPSVDRPYTALAMVYAEAGQPEVAKRLLAEYEREVPATIRQGNLALSGAKGHVALAEGRFEEAAREFRAWHEAGDDFCTHCAELMLGRTYEQAGNTDSALALYQRAVTAPNAFRMYQEENQLGQTYKRMGELYEQSGDTAQAVEYYNSFVELWSGADSELQPIVEDVRARIARLVGEG